ncbi:hypothetical protein ACHAWU_000449 [Discostella pseudostelligera]|uniref:N-acetyltransferase domain-containing protein n=1 Tax=Discostella pseudostelligera TaxID=259834 RepID=A0ABD3LZJ0_9STRA
MTIISLSATPPSSDTIADIEEITTFASNNGIKLNFSVRGPGYRGTATALSTPSGSASSSSSSSNDDPPILGYVEGFIRPGGKILHADRMEIFNSKQKMGGTFLGPGLLIAYICFLHGYESGCTTCEFLAIDDAEYQHKRLVRYYGSAGFKAVRYVGENLRDIPDRLVWGGCGTLMTQDISVVLEKWTRIIRRASSSGGMDG